MSVTLDISGTIHHMVVICGSQVQNDNISRGFIIFSKFSFLRLLGGSKEKMSHNDKKLCFLQFISQEPYII